MNNPNLLIIVCILIAFALVSRRSSSRRGTGPATGERSVRRVERMGGSAMQVLITAAVVVGIQWGVLANIGAPIVWAVTLTVPALLAGATVSRLLAVTDVAPTHSRGGCR